MARKHTCHRVNPSTGIMETARMRRSKARQGGWSTDRTTAKRRVIQSTDPLTAELDRIRAMGRDELRREAVAQDIPDRRNKGKEWLLEALCNAARARHTIRDAVAA